MFVVASDGWYVRSLADHAYPVLIVLHGGKLLGVAGGDDGLASLLDDVVQDGLRKAHGKRLSKPPVYKIVRVEDSGTTVSKIALKRQRKG